METKQALVDEMRSLQAERWTASPARQTQIDRQVTDLDNRCEAIYQAEGWDR